MYLQKPTHKDITDFFYVHVCEDKINITQYIKNITRSCRSKRKKYFSLKN